ncbi:hypothetical protein QBC34DRAFT_312355 [Podospora aff. communis PSN243]|uniref:LysM domain-containing protein n=1 Tax=Podospora aff. communis PSN243 TaxID=3040156 RepID=A0AAV9G451_9PEZI|nr:hypothetical protein QBC34DRAFT_312355 [Podospora aff. communis PSN243]
MAKTFTFWAALAVGLVSTQQLPDAFYPYDTLGLGERCFNALTTTVPSCPGWLGQHAGGSDSSFEMLDLDRATQLCNSTCKIDLVSLRYSITSKCSNVTDRVVPDGYGGAAYPATYFTDRCLFAIQAGCMIDPDSGQYCDVLASNWMGNYSLDRSCSFCELGIQQVQLASPFGYSEQGAEDFSASTQSCNATGYAYATPTSIALNSTSVSQPEPRNCSRWYTIAEGDDCVVISGVNSVSTYSIIQTNSLDLSCDFLPATGEKICLGPQCSIYQLGLYESCAALATTFNITIAQLLAWNPMINPLCTRLVDWTGWYICVSPPGFMDTNSNSTAIAGLGPGSPDATATQAPLPTTNPAPSSNPRCAQWYSVHEGDTCQKISITFGITLDDLLFLNPQLNQNCTNLWLNTSYCVQPVGNIATYTSYPTSIISTSFTRPPPEPTPSFTPLSAPPELPRAPGTIESCILYVNGASPNPTTTFNNNTTTNPDSDLNSCDSWARTVNVQTLDLLEWNPSLSPQNCSFSPGFSYCARKWDVRPSVTRPHDYCLTPDMEGIPVGSISPGRCSCFVGLRVEDREGFNCSVFPGMFNVSAARVVELNPWIGEDCDGGLFSGVNEWGYELVCVEEVVRNGTGVVGREVSKKVVTTGVREGGKRPLVVRRKLGSGEEGRLDLYKFDQV